ncbi:uncharacterized protein LOC124145244 isoform X2 [Haliotis rufescens]|uniref:uncharacterized protein LOC124145244 isoform X2 n=1 Tax=Haliotis rufescens TaxID=6454 RepID=UPI00201EFE8C|nr:uncharacterized protein LOC124145244 isoform X2 [Haliotis rufescens]
MSWDPLSNMDFSLNWCNVPNMDYLANHYNMVTRNVKKRVKGHPGQESPRYFRPRFRPPYPMRPPTLPQPHWYRPDQNDGSNTSEGGYSCMGDNSRSPPGLYPQYWNGIEQVAPPNDVQFTEDVSLTWNADPSAYFEGLEQTVPPCNNQLSEDWSVSWCSDLSEQLFPRQPFPQTPFSQQPFPQQQFLAPNPAPMQYPVPQSPQWIHGPMRRRHNKNKKRLDEPYTRPPTSAAVSQTITTQLRQMKPFLQSLLVAWKQDKLDLAAICVAVYDDDNALTNILWLDKPGTHALTLFGDKGVKIEAYGLGKVGKSSGAFYVSVSGRKTVKLTLSKDYSKWETLVLRRKTCDRSLMDALVMKESFQMFPKLLVQTHYKMSVEDPGAPTLGHGGVDHSAKGPVFEKTTTTTTATSAHGSRLLGQTQNTSLHQTETHATLVSTQGCIKVVVKTTTGNTRHKPIKSKTGNECTTVNRTQDNICNIWNNTVRTSCNVSHAVKPCPFLRPLLCYDSLSELSAPSTSADDSDTVSSNTCTSQYTPITGWDVTDEMNRNVITQSRTRKHGSHPTTTAMNVGDMGASGFTLGGASRCGVATGGAGRCGVATGVASRCGVATGDAVTAREAVVLGNAVSRESVADRFAFVVLDSNGYSLTVLDSDFEGEVSLGFEDFETLQAPVKRSKVGNGEVRVFDQPAQQKVENLKPGRKRPFSELSNSTVGGNQLSKNAKKKKLRKIAKAKKKLASGQKNVKRKSPLLPPRVDLEDRQVMLPKVDLEDRQMLLPRVNLEDRQMLLPRVDLEDRQMMLPRVDLEDRQMLPPRVDLEDRQMLLLLRFHKSGKVYFIRGRMKNGELDIPFSLIASEKYEARMFELDRQTASLRAFSINSVSSFLTFTTSLTLKHLEILQEMAEDFICKSRSKYHHLKHFYRNKPRPYFGDILYNHDGVMKAYLKDHNGDQGSPINGKLNGLFFSASVQFSTGKVPSTSCFGDKRLYVPADVLFDMDTCLYFTDFYCTSSRGPHYVTLVMTRKGSDADVFCQTRLRQLNPFNNPFLYKENSVYGWQVFTCTCSVCLNIEVFYTENVDIGWLLDRHRNDAYFENVETFGQGHSSLMGIPKNTRCNLCNLQLGLPSTKRQHK